MEQGYPTREQVVKLMRDECSESRCDVCEIQELCWGSLRDIYAAMLPMFDELDRRQAEIDSRASSMVQLGQMVDEQVNQIVAARDLVRRMAECIRKNAPTYTDFAAIYPGPYMHDCKSITQSAESITLLAEAEAMTKEGT